MNNTILDFRCTCGKLLCKGDFSGGIVEIKCKKCDRIARFGDKKTRAVGHIVLITPQGRVKCFDADAKKEPLSFTLCF